IQANPPDDVTGATGDGFGRNADERVGGGGLRRFFVGVVPVDLVARGPRLRGDLLQIEDADKRRLDGLAEGSATRRHAKYGADEQAVAGNDRIGRGQGDGVAGLDVVLHGLDPLGKTKGGPSGPPACQDSGWVRYAPGFL